jgi:glucosamine kinase
MILIADSGSTKTDWVLADENLERHPFTTSGINPFILSAEQIENILVTQIHIGIDRSSIKEIYFYGAGCSDEVRCGMIRESLKKLFSNAQIEVNHDLLGAARALCGNERGIAAILGTGSNSCLYDGEKIIESIPSLGYILGDEGSGAHIAKKFIAAYIYREMPDDLKSNVDGDGITKENVIQELYGSAAPSAYLAGYMTTVTKYIQHPFVTALVKNSFAEFLEHHICRYTGFKEIPMHCTGSVAYNFSNLLKEAAAEKKVTVGRIIDKPIHTLADFHLL